MTHVRPKAQTKVRTGLDVLLADQLDLLAGTDELHLDLDAGGRVADITADWERPVTDWMHTRAKYTLYDRV